MTLRIRDGFMLREIADTFIVIPIGEKTVEFNGLMTLSESGAFLWNNLKNDVSENTLLLAILGEYTVDEATAKEDINNFISALISKGLIE